MATSASPQALAGRVLFGTCGWSDDSIAKCGRFYPAWVKTAEQRLEVYGKHFPCVEVDSSTYAIPRPAVTASWAAKVPPGFKFHFKAFGLFCHRSCPFGALPWEVKQQLQQRQHQGSGGGGGERHDRHHQQHGGSKDVVTLEELGPEGEAEAWAVFNRCLEPVVQAKRMGAVVFQFQLNFKPSPDARAYVGRCRALLRPDVRMAVEFRNRAWFSGSPAVPSELRSWLAGLRPPGSGPAGDGAEAGSGHARTGTAETDVAAGTPAPGLGGEAGECGPAAVAATEQAGAAGCIGTCTSTGTCCAPGGPFGPPIPYGVGLVAADELRHETYGSAAQRAAYQQHNHKQQQQRQGAVQGSGEAAPGSVGTAQGIAGEAVACDHGSQQVTQGGGEERGGGPGGPSQGAAGAAAAAAPAATPARPGSVVAAGGGDILPIAMEVCDPSCFYVRLHRREGTTERLLGAEEVQAWAQRLTAVSPRLQGPIYFLIGTDWEDAPIVNAKALVAALPPRLLYDWRAVLAAAAAQRPGTIHALLAAGGKRGGGGGGGGGGGVCERGGAAGGGGGAGGSLSNGDGGGARGAGVGGNGGAPPAADGGNDDSDSAPGACAAAAMVRGGLVDARGATGQALATGQRQQEQRQQQGVRLAGVPCESGSQKGHRGLNSGRVLQGKQQGTRSGTITAFLDRGPGNSGGGGRTSSNRGAAKGDRGGGGSSSRVTPHGGSKTPAGAPSSGAAAGAAKARGGGRGGGDGGGGCVGTLHAMFARAAAVGGSLTPGAAAPRAPSPPVPAGAAVTAGVQHIVGRELAVGAAGDGMQREGSMAAACVTGAGGSGTAGAGGGCGHKVPASPHLALRGQAGVGNGMLGDEVGLGCVDLVESSEPEDEVEEREGGGGVGGAWGLDAGGAGPAAKRPKLGQ